MKKAIIEDVVIDDYIDKSSSDAILMLLLEMKKSFHNQF